MAFQELFRELSPGMTPYDVEKGIGGPDHAEHTVVPAGSAWGEQDGLTYKIRAGQPVMQWVYCRDGYDHCVWFARVRDRWMLTLRVSLPGGMATRRP